MYHYSVRCDDVRSVEPYVHSERCGQPIHVSCFIYGWVRCAIGFYACCDSLRWLCIVWRWGMGGWVEVCKYIQHIVQCDVLLLRRVLSRCMVATRAASDSRHNGARSYVGFSSQAHKPVLFRVPPCGPWCACPCARKIATWRTAPMAWSPACAIVSILCGCGRVFCACT